MANILPKIDYNDGDILYGNDLNASNEVIKAGVDDNFARIQALDLEKQDILNGIEALDVRTTTLESEMDVSQIDISNIKAKISNQHDNYSKMSPYWVGRLVIYDSLLYRCITNILEPEEWNPSHWVQTTLSAETNDALSDIDSLENACVGLEDRTFSLENFALNLDSRLDYVEPEVNTLNSDVNTLKDDVAILKDDINTIENNVSNKQDKLVSGTNIKTINGNRVLGSGNIVIAGGGGSGTGDVIGPISSIDGSIPVFDGETGKVIKDSGVIFDIIESNLYKVTELTAENDDDDYPSAKAVYDNLLLKEDKLPETPSNPESKFLNGNKQWSPIVIGSGGFASNIYMTNIISDLVPAYKKSSSINDTVETIVSATCNNNNEVLAATYLYDTNLATEIVDAGSWRFNLFSAIDAAAGDSKFKVEVFERLANGTEIVLFSAYSSTIENRVGYEGYIYNMIETIQPSFNVNLTSRLGHRIYATTTAAGDRILSYKIGDGSASYLNTPLALRHSQLRDKNGEELYQHITQTEKDKLGQLNVFSVEQTLDSNSTVNVPSVAAVKTVNDNLENAEGEIDNAEAVIGNETDTYSASSTYALGSLVIYNSLLYKCTTAITVAEAWTIAHWTQIDLVNVSSGLKGKILWTNPSPTSQFAAKTVTLSETIANYDSYEVIYIGDASLNKAYMTTGRIPKIVSQLTYNYHFNARREITSISGTSIVFGNGTYFATYASDAVSTSNYLAVPWIIIGYKTGLFS